jgi:hypothetical protein
MGRHALQDYNHLSSTDIQNIRQWYLEAHGNQLQERSYVTDKQLHNFLRIPIIRHAFPEARIVHVIRAPLDNCFSIFENNFSGFHRYSHGLEDLGNYYLMYAEYMDTCRTLAPDFFYDLNYQDLVDNPEEEIRKLLAYCSLEFDTSCLTPHKTNRTVTTASKVQVRTPINRSSIQRWKVFERQLKPLIDILGAPD